MNLTSGRLLKAMELGRVYLATELAQRLNTTALEVKGALCVLVEDGLVRMSNQSSRILSFERMPAGSGSVTCDEGMLTTVATRHLSPASETLRCYRAACRTTVDASIAGRLPAAD